MESGAPGGRALLLLNRRGEPPRPTILKTRLAIVLSHPVQYYSPWFRHLAAREELESCAPPPGGTSAVESGRVAVGRGAGGAGAGRVAVSRARPATPTPAARWADVPNTVLTPHTAGGTLYAGGAGLAATGSLACASGAAGAGFRASSNREDCTGGADMTLGSFGRFGDPEVCGVGPLAARIRWSRPRAGA